jgi:RNA polymerase sigma-70 factor (ECF subfamily)
MLQRAHRTVDERLPERSQQTTLRALGDARLRELVDRYVRAWEEGDVETIVALLAADATLTMPPRPSWFRGREAIGAFLAARPLAPGRAWRRQPLRASGQLGFALFLRDAGERRFEPIALELLTIGDDGLIAAIDSFHERDLLRRFGI